MRLWEPIPSLFLLCSSSSHLAHILFCLLSLTVLDDRLDTSVLFFWVTLPCVQSLLKLEKQLFLLASAAIVGAFTSWGDVHIFLCRAANRNTRSLKWPVICQKVSATVFIFWSPNTEPRRGAEVQFVFRQPELQHAERLLWDFCPMAPKRNCLAQL